jgi:hypothetical protein
MIMQFHCKFYKLHIWRLGCGSIRGGSKIFLRFSVIVIATGYGLNDGGVGV